MKSKVKQEKLVQVNVRLLSENVAKIKQIAAERGIPWQVELRLLVRRALLGQQQDFIIIKDKQDE